MPPRKKTQTQSKAGSKPTPRATGKAASPKKAATRQPKKSAAAKSKTPKSRTNAKRASTVKSKKSRLSSSNAGRASSKAVKRVPCTDGNGLEIEVFPVEPARVRVLRRGLDLSSYYIYLDAFSLEVDGSAVTIQQPNTSMMSEFWTNEGGGVFTVGVSEQVLVHPDLMMTDEREQLLRGVGKRATATLSFRADGDSPALIEGKDFELLAPHRIEMRSVELCPADW